MPSEEVSNHGRTRRLVTNGDSICDVTFCAWSGTGLGLIPGTERSSNRSKSHVQAIQAITFAMLHYMQRPKIKDLAAQLGINRVSFARLARRSGIPGLVRTATKRWKVLDK